MPRRASEELRELAAISGAPVGMPNESRRTLESTQRKGCRICGGSPTTNSHSGICRPMRLEAPAHPAGEGAAMSEDVTISVAAHIARQHKLIIELSEAVVRFLGECSIPLTPQVQMGICSVIQYFLATRTEAPQKEFCVVLRRWNRKV